MAPATHVLSLCIYVVHIRVFTAMLSFHCPISTRCCILYTDNYRTHSRYVVSVLDVIIQSVKPYFVATKMVGRKVPTSFFVPSTFRFSSSLLATLGLESETFGYFTHWIQGSILVHLIPRWLNLTLLHKAVTSFLYKRRK